MRTFIEEVQKKIDLRKSKIFVNQVLIEGGRYACRNIQVYGRKEKE